jgi:hypothetical protein
LVIHNNPTHKFVWVLKKSILSSKSKGASLQFYRKPNF